VIAQTAGGDDIEDMLKARAEELKLAKELGLVYDTDPNVYVPAESRGQVLLDDEGNPVPAAVVTAQGLSDAGLTMTGAPPGQQPGQPGAAPPEKPEPKQKPAPTDTTEVDDDEEDRSSKLRLINSIRER
jgi:hypothetical protein